MCDKCTLLLLLLWGKKKKAYPMRQFISESMCVKEKKGVGGGGRAKTYFCLFVCYFIQFLSGGPVMLSLFRSPLMTKNAG